MYTTMKSNRVKSDTEILKSKQRSCDLNIWFSEYSHIDYKSLKYINVFGQFTRYIFPTCFSGTLPIEYFTKKWVINASLRLIYSNKNVYKITRTTKEIVNKTYKKNCKEKYIVFCNQFKENVKN